MNNLSRPDSLKDLQELRNEWPQGLNAVARCDQYDDRKRKRCAILLMFHVSVTRNHHIELLAGATEKLSIAEASPPGLLHRSRFVTRQLPTEVAGQGFVKQDAHLR